MFLSVVLLLLGFVMLVKGADWFVDGASGLAEKIRIPQLVVGLTVVAFGTSAPELAVSVASAVKGSADLAVGNVVGSNILNILLILGLAAVLSPLPVNRQLRFIDLPVLLGSSALFLLFIAFDHRLDRWEGILFVCFLVFYTAILVFFALRARKEADKIAPPPPPVEEGPKGKYRAWYEGMKGKAWFLVLLLLVGLALVVFGADVAVNAATDIAKRLEVPERIVGLTVVAIGTSLPELVTSTVAAIKGKTDIAVGNIVGSNIFNILLVAGLSSAIAPAFVPDFTIDAAVALGAAVLLAVLAYLPSHKIKRLGGAAMLVCAAGYFVYLFLSTGV